MTIKLYMTPGSPAVRAVRIAAKALGIDLELKPVDTVNDEHKSPEFLKINPQHTVPVIDDNGTILWDSHAINAYLVSKYAKKDSLYPKDLVKRAIVDQRLHFDSGVLFPRTMKAMLSIYKDKKTKLEQEHIDGLTEGYEFLEKFLEGRQWIAGDSVTIADYSIYTTVSIVNLALPIDSKKYPKLSTWFTKADALPECEVCQEQLKQAKVFMDKALGK